MPTLRSIKLASLEASAATQPFSCSVSLQLQDGLLLLGYEIFGPLRQLIIPAEVASPCFTPGLWQRSCFECFLRQEDIKNYTEWNFSPCGNWWVCVFDDYRKPARRQPQNFQQQLGIKRTGILLTLTATIACPQKPALRIGPALILEHAGGSRSHWAIKHPGGKPDFHLAETCAYVP